MRESDQAAAANEESADETHFYKCRACDEMVDKRQLDDVLFHEDHKQRPDIPYSGDERIQL